MQEIKISRRQRKKILKHQRKLSYQWKHRNMRHHVGYYLGLIFFLILDAICAVFRFFGKLCVVGLVCAVLMGLILYKDGLRVILPFYQEAQALAEKSEDSDFHINEGTIIYDDAGAVLANLYDTSFNTYLSYKEIPEDVVHAFIAIEDRTFWDNDGVDYKGILRVGLRFLMTKGEEAHGASTITQQLARTTYLTREKALSRKVKEIFLSWELTKKYSKERIMEYYVNTCNYGNGIYGIEGASQAYFNKPAKKLTLAESAYLAAIPNRPSYYNPWNDVQTAIPRQQKILRDMLQIGYINTTEYEDAMKQPIVLEKKASVYNDYLSTYAIDCAVRYLMELDNYDFKYEFADTASYDAYQKQYDMDYAVYKQKLYTGGYRIHTTLNQEKYRQLQAILDATLAEYNNEQTEDGIYAFQGGMAVIDNQTHKVIALIGGRSGSSGNSVYSFNRAYQAYRQPGSSIKPLIVYTPALAHGWTPDTTVRDIDVSIAKLPGVDAQGLSGSEMSLRYAVEHSKNGVAWQVFDALGPKTGLSYIQKQHFTGICPDDYHDAAALGGLTHGVTTVEMASAYETIANNGVYYEPTCIDSFLDKDGRELFEGMAPVSDVYPADAAVAMRDVCAGVLSNGTAKNLGWTDVTDMPAFAKTGTTNDNKDIWFCGSTPYYSIAVYVGFDMPRKMEGLYGSSYSGAVWRDAMIYLTDGLNPKQFGE